MNARAAGRPERKIAGLRRLRQARHLSLAEVAEKTGISRSHLEKLEYGTAIIGIDACVVLAELYHKSPDAIADAQAQSRIWGPKGKPNKEGGKA